MKKLIELFHGWVTAPKSIPGNVDDDEDPEREKPKSLPENKTNPKIRIKIFNKASCK
tara:strand:- start:81042 stop:81212 length:171 start_codon:yes stop_codon:yes gene_type:complete